MGGASVKTANLSKIFLLAAVIAIICLAAAGLTGNGLESKYLRARQKVTEQESLDKYFSGLVSKNEPGLAAAVIKTPAGHNYMAGVTDIKTLQPITAKTNFRLASVIETVYSLCHHAFSQRWAPPL